MAQVGNVADAKFLIKECELLPTSTAHPRCISRRRRRNHVMMHSMTSQTTAASPSFSQHNQH
jgi:hypothetical protein